MYQSVDYYQFRDAMNNHDCGFSVDGIEILFNYFEQLEQEQGQEIELDPIAFRCEFSEQSPQEIANDYSIDIEHLKTDEEIKDFIVNHLSNNGSLVGVTEIGTIVYIQH